MGLKKKNFDCLKDFVFLNSFFDCVEAKPQKRTRVTTNITKYLLFQPLIL